MFTIPNNGERMPSRKILLTSIAAAGCLILGACSIATEVNQPADRDDSDSSLSDTGPDENRRANDPTESKITPMMPKSENQEYSNPIVGGLPVNILEEIFADLSQRTGANDKNIQVKKSVAVTWNDGSLGCPKPGQNYTQALVDGYWVILQIDEVDYDYRVSDSGRFTLCDGKGGVLISDPGDVNPNE